MADAVVKSKAEKRIGGSVYMEQTCHSDGSTSFVVGIAAATNKSDELLKDICNLVTKYRSEPLAN